MSHKILTYSCLILFGVFISSLSQVLLKKASEKKYDSIFKEYLNPLVIFAYAVFFAATLLSVVAYKVVPLSFGPILEATSYIYVTWFSVKIFKEKINIFKIMALVLIIVGIVVFSI